MATTRTDQHGRWVDGVLVEPSPAFVAEEQAKAAEYFAMKTADTDDRAQLRAVLAALDAGSLTSAQHQRVTARLIRRLVNP